MKHRSAALATVAALAVGPLALTATAAAAPAPTTATVADDSIDATRERIEDSLARSAERIARAQQAQSSRREAGAPESTERTATERSATESTDSAASALSALATTGRIFGVNRYDTAVKISRDSHPDPAGDFGGIVFVANGMNFPDALAGGPAAASVHGPILLVPPTGGLPELVQSEIERLDPYSVAILGGTDNVSQETEDDLRELFPAPAQGEESPVFRTAGTNRYETSALLTEFVVKAVDLGNGTWDYTEPDTAIISTGQTFADALAGGAAGGWEYAPLLLTATKTLPPSVVDVLTPIPADPGTGYPGRKFTTVRILGSEAAVSIDVATAIKAILPGATIKRYSGTDRFDTAARLNLDVFEAPAYEVTMTNGLRFPDALAGAPRVNKTGGPTVLVRTECVPAPTVGTLTAFTPSSITALGNVDAVSAAALNGTPCPTR